MAEKKCNCPFSFEKGGEINETSNITGKWDMESLCNFCEEISVFETAYNLDKTALGYIKGYADSSFGTIIVLLTQDQILKLTFDTQLLAMKAKAFFEEKFEGIYKIYQTEGNPANVLLVRIIESEQPIQDDQGFEAGGDLQKELDNFDWEQLFNNDIPSKEKLEEFEKELKAEEKAHNWENKQKIFKAISATGKDWNDAALFRIKLVKGYMADMIRYAKSGRHEDAFYAFEDSLKEIDGLRGLEFEARKYANLLEKRLRYIYDDLYHTIPKYRKYKEGGEVKKGIYAEMQERKKMLQSYFNDENSPYTEYDIVKKGDVYADLFYGGWYYVEDFSQEKTGDYINLQKNDGTHHKLYLVQFVRAIQGDDMDSDSRWLLTNTQNKEKWDDLVQRTVQGNKEREEIRSNYEQHHGKRLSDSEINSMNRYERERYVRGYKEGGKLENLTKDQKKAFSNLNKLEKKEEPKSQTNIIEQKKPSEYKIEEFINPDDSVSYTLKARNLQTGRWDVLYGDVEQIKFKKILKSENLEFDNIKKDIFEFSTKQKKFVKKPTSPEFKKQEELDTESIRDAILILQDLLDTVEGQERKDIEEAIEVLKMTIE